MSERSLQRAIIALLEADREVWWLKTPADCRNGTPDLIGCCRGRFFAWELKTRQGRLRRRQRVEKKRIERARGSHRTIRSRRDAIEALKRLKRRTMRRRWRDTRWTPE